MNTYRYFRKDLQQQKKNVYPESFIKKIKKVVFIQKVIENSILA